MLFGGLLAVTLSGGFEDTRKYDEPKPARTEHAKEAPKRREIDSPVFLRVKGDTKTRFEYTFYLKNPHFEKYRGMYKALRVEVKGPTARLDFNEVYDLQKGERAHWKPIEETTLRVVKEGLGLRFKNLPKELFIGVYGINDGREEKIYADRAYNSWVAGAAEFEPKK